MNTVAETEIKAVSTLAPHQQRVVEEKRELDDKLQKLTAFVSSEKFSTIVQDEAERGRLVCQEEVMRQYSEILGERIDAFVATEWPEPSGIVLTESDAMADLNGTPRPDHPTQGV